MENKKLESDNLNELYTALAKAQGEMEIAISNSVNPFFKSKYSDLTSIVKASRSYLAKYGLSVIQRVMVNDDGKMSLYTRLGHSSGQWLEETMPINPEKNGIQEIGKYITYLRRYCYAAITGVVAEEEDDDGESAMKDIRNNGNGSKSLGNGSQNLGNGSQNLGNGKISKEQLAILNKELEHEDLLLENILNGYKIEKLSDLKKENFDTCLSGIKKRKEERPF